MIGPINQVLDHFALFLLLKNCLIFGTVKVLYYLLLAKIRLLWFLLGARLAARIVVVECCFRGASTLARGGFTRQRVWRLHLLATCACFREYAKEGGSRARVEDILKRPD